MQLGSLAGALDFNRAVVVAVLSMRVVEVVANEVVDVRAVRDLLVSATGPVDMVDRMPDACMLWRAAVRVAAADLDAGTVEVIAMRDVHVAVMQVRGLPAVTDGGMPARGTVCVPVLLVLIFAFHENPHEFAMRGERAGLRSWHRALGRFNN